jgi:hypothetical protein
MMMVVSITSSIEIPSIPMTYSIFSWGIQECFSTNWYFAVPASKPVTRKREQIAVNDVTASVQNLANDSPVAKSITIAPTSGVKISRLSRGNPSFNIR